MLLQHIPFILQVQLALATVYINECMELEALEVLKQWITSYLDGNSIPLEFRIAPSSIIEDLTIRTQQVIYKVTILC